MARRCDKKISIFQQKRAASLLQSSYGVTSSGSMPHEHFTDALTRGVHREWEFPFPVFPMGIPREWEWTMYNLGTGMGMGITMREWEGMGMSKCGKIPEPQDSHSSCTY